MLCNNRIIRLRAVYHWKLRPSFMLRLQPNKQPSFDCILKGCTSPASNFRLSQVQTLAVTIGSYDYPPCRAGSNLQFDVGDCLDGKWNCSIFKQTLLSQSIWSLSMVKRVEDSHYVINTKLRWHFISYATPINSAQRLAEYILYMGSICSGK
jgi:hypothetical protein